LLGLRVRSVRALDGPARQPAGRVGKARHPQPHSEYARLHRQLLRPNSKATLLPPNANELARTLRQGVSSRAVGTFRPRSTSTGSAPTLRGIQPCSMATIENTASVAPPAPSRWPV